MVERVDSQLPHSQRREDGGSGIGESNPDAALGTQVARRGNSERNIFESSQSQSRQGIPRNRGVSPRPPVSYTHLTLPTIYSV